MDRVARREIFPASRVPAPAGSRRGRALVRRILLLFLSCTVTLGLVEITLRTIGHRVLPGGESVSVGKIFNKNDHPLGFSLRPGATGWLLSGGDYVQRARINSAGLRDDEHALERPAGTKRILVLGDSFMFGQGVSMEEALPRLLEDEIPGVEVINAGVPGYDLGQEYLYYRERGRRYRPDVVLLAFFVNDLVVFHELDVLDGPDGLPLGYEQRAGPIRSGREKEGKSRGVLAAASDWVATRSVLCSFVRSRLTSQAVTRPADQPARNGALDAPYLPYFLADPDEATRQAWDRGYRILDALKGLASSNGSRLAVVLVPAPWQLSDDAWRRWVTRVKKPETSLSRGRPQEMVAAWCERSATPCLDLRDDFRGGDLDRLYFRYDSHWTAEGHRLATKSVSEFLALHRLP